MERIYQIKKSELLELVNDIFNAGYETSRYDPSPNYNKLKCFKSSSLLTSLFCSLASERQLEIEKIKYLAEYINMVLEESGKEAR